MAEDRKAIHAYLSPEAQDGWAIRTEENGVSVAALLEVLGVRLASIEGPAVTCGDEGFGDLIVAARKVDALRRRRGGNQRSAATAS